MRYEEIKIQVPGSNKEAHLEAYILKNSSEIGGEKKRSLILMCPGGAYMHTSDREAEPIAMKFLAMGYHVVVLRYSIKPAIYPTALLEVGTAMLHIREHAKEWCVDENKIIVQGSSAGGHLAANYATAWSKDSFHSFYGVEKEQLRPNGLMLSYPVITSGEYAHRPSFENLLGEFYDVHIDKVSLEHCVNEDVPPTFIWHTQPDDVVPIENALLLVGALAKAKISTEFHMYPVGGHGLSLANELSIDPSGFGVQRECESWIGLACDWVGRL